MDTDHRAGVVKHRDAIQRVSLSATSTANLGARRAWVLIRRSSQPAFRHGFVGSVERLAATDLRHAATDAEHHTSGVGMVALKADQESYRRTNRLPHLPR